MRGFPGVFYPTWLSLTKHQRVCILYICALTIEILQADDRKQSRRALWRRFLHILTRMEMP